jgi:hypothetical protein
MLRNLRISNFFYAFGAILTCNVAMGVFAVVGLVRSGHVIHALISDTIPAVKVLAEIRSNVGGIRRSGAMVFLCKEQDHVCVDRETKLIQKWMTGLNKSLDLYAPMVGASDEKKLYEQVRQGADAYMAIASRVTELYTAGKRRRPRR